MEAPLFSPSLGPPHGSDKVRGWGENGSRQAAQIWHGVNQVGLSVLAGTVASCQLADYQSVSLTIFGLP
jgi:hypothetical protein